ncbi:radical SAM protein [Bacteroidales bacterium OttesenSCG-928-J16]|nr:radical SAM protein [Bacteroidales bacterium OttesenSCG-928-J16]
MKIYALLKLNRIVKSRRIKSLGIFLLHVFRQRYIAVFFDPVLGCNFRCKMCYFSDPNYRKDTKGVFNPDELPKLADAFFGRALKLQIGCGAEPSLYQHNTDIIRLAKQRGVPYISMTSNANLFSDTDLWEFAKAGLDEMTLSLHGVVRESYEYFMTNGSYDKFLQTLETLTAVKKEYPNFKIRINYTVNNDNVKELALFFEHFSTYSFDILQIRPIQEIGDSEYKTFSWDALREVYDDVILKVRQDCAERGVVCIAPSKNDLEELSSASDQSLVESAYCYISPKYIWKDDFDLQKERFNSYSKKHHIGRMLFKNIFAKKREAEEKRQKLNYTIN